MLFGFTVRFSAQRDDIFKEDHLAGTQLIPATEAEEIRSRMLHGMNRFFEEALESSPQKRKTNGIEITSPLKLILSRSLRTGNGLRRSPEWWMSEGR